MTTGSRVTIEDLLAHSGWVHGLARRLAGDVHDADDAEQQTWAAALSRPPPRRENLRAWLARVLRRRILDRRRGEARRSRAERSAGASPPDNAPAVDTLVERAETQMLVAREVLALDEPYRTTVLLRFFEGRSAEEIAALQVVPVATVRTRLQRAAAQLRERLARVLGGAYGKWVRAAAPTAAWGGGLSGTVVGGSAVMAAKSKAVVALGIAALLGGGYAVVTLVGAGHTEESAARETDVIAAARVERDDPALAGRGMASAPAAGVEAPKSVATTGRVAEGATAPKGVIGGTVRDASGQPVKAEVLLWDEIGRQILRRVPTDADGVFRFEGLADGVHALSIHARGRAAVSTHARVSARLFDVTVPDLGTGPGEEAALSIAGIVVEKDTGQGLGGIPVLAWPAEGGGTSGGFAKTAEDGTFKLDRLAKGAWLLDVGSLALTVVGPESEFLTQRAGPFEGGAKGVRVEIVRGAAITGEIRGLDGAPWTAGASVKAIHIADSGQTDFDRQRWVTAGADGTFRLPGLVAGFHDLTIEVTATAEGAAGIATARAPRVPAGFKGVIVNLERGQEVRGRLVDEHDVAITTDGWVWVYESGTSPGTSGSVRAALAGDGSFRTPALDPGRTWFLRALGFPGYRDGEPLRVRPGPDEVTVRMTRGLRIAGKVVDTAGNPVLAFVPVLAAAEPTGSAASSAGAYASSATDAQGRFELGGLLADTRYRLLAGGGASGWISSKGATGIVAPATDVVLVVERGVVLSGRVVNKKGEPVPSLLLTAVRNSKDAGNGANARTDADGRFHFDGVPRGEIVVGTMVDGAYVGLGTRTAPATDVTFTLPD